MSTTQLSDNARAFFEEFPEIERRLLMDNAKGNFDAGYTPTIVAVKFEWLTYIRYENGQITGTRKCSKEFEPSFWEVCFDDEEIALFVFGKNEVLLDRTGDMAQLDFLMKDCNFIDNTRKQPQTTKKKALLNLF